MKDSVIVELINHEDNEFLIRKKKPELKEKYAKFLGYNIEKIK